MPASLALVKTYWTGAARQRAVSLWSVGEPFMIRNGHWGAYAVGDQRLSRPVAEFLLAVGIRPGSKNIDIQIERVA
jgi:hypothetical protein